ncbi:MAG: AraC family transcriptional regulator [Planctomycetota bacterium]
MHHQFNEFQQAHLLPATLWSGEGFARRSGELTPLYVTRYAGERFDAASAGHDFWELLFVFRGEVDLAAGGSHHLGHSTACLIPPGLRHNERSDRVVDTLWVGLDGSRLQALPGDLVLTPPDDDLAEMALQLWLRAENAFGRAGPELDGLTCRLVSAVLQKSDRPGTGGADTIDRAIDYMRRQLDRPMAVGDLAARFGYSEGYFHRQFRQRTGQTPAAFITERRLRRATRLLRQSSMTVAEVAREVGYDDPLYFSRAFRKRYGMSPTAFRQNTRG